jgi:hypothetical protein
MEKTIAISIVALLLLSCLSVTSAQSSDLSIAQKATIYLVNSYNSTLHLFPETSANKVFYITSDNLLASYAIKNYNSTLYNEVTKSIKSYAINYSLPVDDDGLPISYKHEAVTGEVIQGSINDSDTFTLFNNSQYVILSEIANRTTTANAMGLADVSALKGISLCNQNLRDQAVEYYNQMMALWDGYGFNDDAHQDVNNNPNHVYATYKLGLAILLSNKLSINNGTLNERMISIIKACQLENGGIKTDYIFDGSSIIPSGLANTETTSIIAIANPSNQITQTPQPTINPSPTVPELSMIFPALILIAAIVTALMLKLKKQKSTQIFIPF